MEEGARSPLVGTASCFGDDSCEWLVRLARGRRFQETLTPPPLASAHTSTTVSVQGSLEVAAMAVTNHHAVDGSLPQLGAGDT